MKKLVVLSLCLICSIVTIQAQNTFILRHGLNFSTQTFSAGETVVNYDYITGSGGAFAYRAELGKGFAIQPELAYLDKGSLIEVDQVTTLEIDMFYMEIPILLVYQPVKTNKFGISLFGGPSVGLGLLGTIELDDKTTANDYDESASINWGDDGFKRTEFSWTFGTDIQFRVSRGKFLLDFRYLMGRSDIGGTLTQPSNGELRNNGFGLSIGYAYPIGTQRE